jgi:hypothetical protein
MSPSTSDPPAKDAGEPVKYEDLPDEFKKRYDELKAQLEAELIGAFERTRSRGIRFKGFTPEGVLDGIDFSTPSEERSRALRQEINYIVAHSIHRHAESLVNSLERVAVSVVQEIMKHRYYPTGPALGTHHGEQALYDKQPLPFALAAPEPQGQPAYVVYKVGGDPNDYQFLSEPPKDVPHGYACAYVPDSNEFTRMNQVAIQANPTQFATRPVMNQLTMGSTPGPEAEKQAWLAKYATRPQQESMTPAAPTMDQISTILRDQFGITPKRRSMRYAKPYPDEYDLIPMPPKYRLPEFSKFSGSEGASSMEHISRYLNQLGLISASDNLRVRFFSQSLTGPAFG